MQPNAQGWCDSYYGTWNVKHKPRLGVAYFMLDEHIKKLVDKEKENFNREIGKVVTDFTKSMKELISKQNEEMKSIHCSIGEMSKFIFKLIDINKLETPSIEKKPVKKSKAKPKQKVSDGYL